MINIKWVIFQLYYGENKLHFDKMMIMMSSFVLDQHTEFDFYRASSLKHDVPLGYIILIIMSQQVFPLTQ